MANRVTSIQNNFATVLTGSGVSDNSLEFPVATKGTLTSPSIITIDPESTTKAEIILMDGVFGASSFVTTSLSNRGLAGSAGGAQQHDPGTPVVSVPLAQHIQDLNDRASLHSHATTGPTSTKVSHNNLSDLGDTSSHPDFLLKNGTRALTAPISGVTPTQGSHLTTRASVQSMIDLTTPIGALILWTWSTTPTGFLVPNGQAISRTTYATYFALVGTFYGPGNGTTTFNMPDYAGLFPVFTGGGYSLNDRGGAAQVTLTANEIPTHDHGAQTQTDTHEHLYDGSVADGVGGSTRLKAGNQDTGRYDNAAGAIDSDEHSHAINEYGGGQPHENRPPLVGLTPLVRVL